MSAYGKLWEKVASIRDQIKRDFPGVRTNRLEEARQDAEVESVAQGRRERLDELLSRWGDLEDRMRETE